MPDTILDGSREQTPSTSASSPVTLTLVHPAETK
jgi:hypothetical protein